MMEPDCYLWRVTYDDGETELPISVLTAQQVLDALGPESLRVTKLERGKPTQGWR